MSSISGRIFWAKKSVFKIDGQLLKLRILIVEKYKSKYLLFVALLLIRFALSKITGDCK